MGPPSAALSKNKFQLNCKYMYIVHIHIKDKTFLLDSEKKATDRDRERVERDTKVERK